MLRKRLLSKGFRQFFDGVFERRRLVAPLLEEMELKTNPPKFLHCFRTEELTAIHGSPGSDIEGDMICDYGYISPFILPEERRLLSVQGF
jgi:hypothetical protein